MHTSLAPLRLASCASRQKCTLLVMALLPQMRMSLLSEKNCTFMPSLLPKVWVSASAPALAQMVRSSCAAPNTLKKRMAMDSPCTMPMVPA